MKIICYRFLMQNDSKKLTVQNIQGRGALENPAGRFEKLTLGLDAECAQNHYDLDLDEFDTENIQTKKRLPTQVFRDPARSIISTNDSPDLCMDTTLNPYRGCEHGCIYCYARPTHEYLGLSVGLDFETKIFAKMDAPELLKQKLAAKSWQPRTLMLSGVTDPYQPIERQMKITRRCLEVLLDFRNPAGIITKNQLVTRDLDIFTQMARRNLIMVNLSITTLDSNVSRLMEPRASQPKLRLRAVEQLAGAGVPVGIMIGPVIPGLTDHEIPDILEAAANAGARSAGYTIVRLPYGVKDLFQTWVIKHFPDRAQKILNRIRSMRDGKLNDPNFNTRMRGEGFFADQIAQIFKKYKKLYGLDRGWPPLSIEHFRRNAISAQLDLFDN